MNKTHNFAHLYASPDEFVGNNGIGRYVLLPGSDGRAQEIAAHLEGATVSNHPRGHNLYLGTLDADGHKVDMAVVSTGMGCPSMEIILHELYHLGAKRFLRIGTAGSLQPWIKVGSLVNASASVRDEDTTERYAPREFPAIASLEVSSAVLLAAHELDLLEDLHTGVVHCKSSLYAREFVVGPRHDENQAYMELISRCGALASEMETASLFIQTQIYNREWQLKGAAPHNQILSGAIMAVVATLEEGYGSKDQVHEAIENSIELGLETMKILALQELP